MKALSIRQPWAHAVVALGKRVENRDWRGGWCSFRGPVLLHASKTLVLRDFDEDVDSIIDLLNPLPGKERIDLLAPLAELRSRGSSLRGCSDPRWRPAQTLPLGGIVGRARIVGALDDGGRGRRAGGADDVRLAFDSPWYAGGFALVLADVEPLPFIPWKGSLGFFDVPDALVAGTLRDQSPRPCAHAGRCGCPSLADL